MKAMIMDMRNLSHKTQCFLMFGHVVNVGAGKRRGLPVYIYNIYIYMYVCMNEWMYVYIYIYMHRPHLSSQTVSTAKTTGASIPIATKWNIQITHDQFAQLTFGHGTWPIFKQVVCPWIFHGKHWDYQRRNITKSWCQSNWTPRSEVASVQSSGFPTKVDREKKNRWMFHLNKIFHTWNGAVTVWNGLIRLNYPLVNVYITMENHHFYSWVNPLKKKHFQ